MTRPVRIQRKRTKGWRMPAGAVYVGRPTKWGNPFTVEEAGSRAAAVRAFRKFLTMPQTKIVDACSNPLAGLFICAAREKLKRDLSELRGKNLACWCPLDQPCHADLLLELANADPAGE
jgi:hypothetical protein